jgi:putative toxin-antitoxin system antitoxin component (TIGR02293 family)
MCSVSFEIPAKAFVRAAKRIGLSRDQLAKILGLKPRTIAARLASGQKLRPEETEKVLRVTHALDLASEAFGSETDAKDWLTSTFFIHT